MLRASPLPPLSHHSPTRPRTRLLPLRFRHRAHMGAELVAHRDGGAPVEADGAHQRQFEQCVAIDHVQRFSVRQIRRCFGPFLTYFQAPPDLTSHGDMPYLVPMVYWMLIGACNPMLRPIHPL